MCGVEQEMQVEVNGLRSQLDYMLNMVDKCRADKMTGRLSASLADNVTSVIDRHGKLQTDICDMLSQIELAQNNVDDFQVRTEYNKYSHPCMSDHIAALIFDSRPSCCKIMYTEPMCRVVACLLPSFRQYLFILLGNR